MAVYHLCVRPPLTEEQMRRKASWQLGGSADGILFDSKGFFLRVWLTMHLDLMAAGLVDFFGDLLNLEGDNRPPYLWAAALAPPAAIAALFGNPSLFFAAVDLAGVYGILVLFGVVPALMAWGSRYGAAALDADDAAPEAVPGGRASLGAIAGFAAAIIGLETYGRLGVG